MAAITSSTMSMKVSAPKVAARKAFSGVSVTAKPMVARQQVNFAVKASSSNQEKLQAAVVTSVGAMLASPLAAQAADYATTPSLKNLISSVIAGATVLTALLGAVAGVSTFDRVSRK
eukprot:CAMPEP_0182867404 /NCGR_PEP_ID=MMETSP0034_2-20130328/8702_1 /TAXON_ID=156128 /ORGANISM="Nephroselmis pyriformis, Strain CCMP717" /LENGTH=116 /DNA_ID=CAMNT_0024999761 /DNA_START=46 /DNA_END=396 /DNA_ORIENTATION=+